jgi:hypothetical protein
LTRCPACGRREKRSSEANRRYWALVALVAENVKPGGNAFSIDQWHKWVKSKWLGCTDTRLPNGATLTEPNSSADLEPAEFSDFMTAFEAWAAEHGVYLPEAVSA